MIADLNRQSMASVHAMQDGAGIVSAYIDLSVPPPAAGADQWRIELRNRVKDLRSRVKEYGNRDYRLAAESALSDLESLAKASIDHSLEGAGGLCVFFGMESSDRIEVRCRVSVPTAVVIRDRAYLPPLLVALRELTPFGLVGLHRNEARIISSNSAGGEELTRFRLDADTSDWRQVSWPTASGKGSAQQANSLKESFEDRLLSTVRKSLGSLAKALADVAHDAGWDVLVVFGDPRLTGEFESSFTPRGGGPGVMASDLVWDEESVEKILRRGKPMVDKWRKRREAELAAEIAGAASAGGPAVIGMRRTAEALGSGRVQTLIFDSSLLEEPDSLLADDRRVPESVEQTVQKALESDVDVIPVYEAPALESEKVAATLRW